MDLNYLLSRHQISLMQADAASCSEARIAHRGRAGHYTERIRELQGKLGAAPALVGQT